MTETGTEVGLYMVTVACDNFHYILKVFAVEQLAIARGPAELAYRSRKKKKSRTRQRCVEIWKFVQLFDITEGEE